MSTASSAEDLDVSGYSLSTIVQLQQPSTSSSSLSFSYVLSNLAPAFEVTRIQIATQVLLATQAPNHCEDVTDTIMMNDGRID
ncbi:426_t:CDS:2 [Paraglomus occultum]|uniref:426_t:CDS:1 n=1 Tax=Paraglomus occultum TaxID=144539 RepID=A0A9N9BZ88_9GLOM|nr:426_t:CDS:2 [Paraglomus occultum]